MVAYPVTLRGQMQYHGTIDLGRSGDPVDVERVAGTLLEDPVAVVDRHGQERIGGSLRRGGGIRT